MAKQWTGALTLAASEVAAVAMAHNGASGVVPERMNSMTAIRDADREAIATYLLDPEGTGTGPVPALPLADTPMAGMDHSQMDMSNEN